LRRWAFVKNAATTSRVAVRREIKMTDIMSRMAENLDSKLEPKEEPIDPHFVITCDGGALDNQQNNGVSVGYGSYFIEIPGRKFKSATKREEFGAGITNNEAEYMIAIAALDTLKDVIEAEGGNCRDYVVEIRTDSQLVIGHMSKGWKLNAQNLRVHYYELRGRLKMYKGITFTKVAGDQMKEIIGH
jgi:ribonuclease HI